MEPFTEIPTKEGDNAFRVRLACGRHSETICLTCCMDFSLYNELRFDPDYLLARNDDERLSRVKSATQSYFKKPVSPEKTSSTVSPRLQPLLDTTLREGNASVENFVELLSYLCYACRNNIGMVERVYSIMVTVLDITKSPEAEVIAFADRGQAEAKRQRKQEKSHGQAPAKGSFSATMQKTNDKLQDAYKEMITILIKAGVKKAPEWGHFFADFRRVTEAMEQFNAEDLAKIMGAMDVSGEMVTLSDDMKEAMKAQAEWLQFLMNHIEGGVPMDDPSGWTMTRLQEFFKKHGLEPPMSTPDDVLVQVARHMVDFCHCCLVLFNNSIPDDEHAEALGRQSMGQATERDRQVIAQREAPVQCLELIMEPQIPASTRLSKLSKWTAGNTLKVFETTRLFHKMNFNVRSLYEMLEQLDEIAVAFDWVTTGEYSDVLVMFSADEGTTEEKSLAVRALDAREIDGVPLLSIQWASAATKGAGPDTASTLFRGIEKGKTTFHNHKISSVAMDLLVSLIAANYDNLDYTDDVVKAFKSQLPLGWKFSVLRPVDPSKKGGVMNCPGCGKSAKKLCAKCKNAAYCSRDCQVSCWKKHKPNCKAPS
jgi:hypothetical protein